MNAQGNSTTSAPTRKTPSAPSVPDPNFEESTAGEEDPGAGVDETTVPPGKRGPRPDTNDELTPPHGMAP